MRSTGRSCWRSCPDRSPCRCGVALDMLDRAEALAHREPDVLRGHIVLEIDEGLRPRGIAIGRQFAAADAGRGDIALDRIAAWFSGKALLLCGRRAGRGAVFPHRGPNRTYVSRPRVPHLLRPSP